MIFYVVIPGVMIMLNLMITSAESLEEQQAIGYTLNLPLQRTPIDIPDTEGHAHPDATHSHTDDRIPAPSFPYHDLPFRLCSLLSPERLA